MAHMTNPLATVEQLHQRNQFSSLPTDLQDCIFYATQCLTQAAGLLLQLPQSTTAQANVILTRYWLMDPMMQHEFSDVSAACIYIVAKCGSFPRSPRDVTNVYAYLTSPVSPLASARTASSPRPPNDPAQYYQTESEYFSAHNRVLALEARILYALSFDTHVSLPHPLAVTYLQALDFLAQPREVVAERAVAYLNAALLSPQMLYVTHQPPALAVAAVYNAARDVGAKMPECEWWAVFDVDREELGFLVVAMRSLDGWVRRQRKNREPHPSTTPGLLGGTAGLLTRRLIEAELERRRLRLQENGGPGSEPKVLDPEADMARMLDSRVESMDES